MCTGPWRRWRSTGRRARRCTRSRWSWRSERRALPEMEPRRVIERRRTVTVDVGGVPVGSAHPVVVQSMTNTDTADPAATAAQVEELALAGSELVRVTVNTEAAAAAVPEIARRLEDAGCDVPVVGDFHYNGHLLLTRRRAAARARAKYRINPGNVGTKHRDDNFRAIVQVALDNDKPVRIGVNWGSLDQQLLTELMDENARRSEPLDALGVVTEAAEQRALRSVEVAGVPDLARVHRELARS